MAKPVGVYWSGDSLLSGQRIVAREADGSCWVAVSEDEKILLENYGTDIAIVTCGDQYVNIRLSDGTVRTI